MIQRKQTLFLFQLVFLGIALLFIPCVTVTTSTATHDVLLIPLNNPEIASTPGHIAAVLINFLGLILAFIAVFLYQRREVQLKLCYAMVILWIVLTAMMAFCPFVKAIVPVESIKINYLALIVGGFGILAAYMAARYIKKDINLIKSADRIR
jgi:hypothetical protein